MKLVVAQNQSATSAEETPAQRAESVVPQGLPFKKEDAPGSALGVSPSWIGLAVILIGVWLFVITKHRRGRSASASSTPALMSWLRAHSSSNGDLASGGQVQLNGHTSVHVVCWDGQDLLIGATAQSVTLLASRPSAADHAKRPLDEAAQ